MFNFSDEAATQIEDRGSAPAEAPAWSGAIPAPVAGFGSETGAPAQPTMTEGSLPAPTMMPLPQSDDGALRRGAGKALLWVSVGLAVGGLAAGPLGAAAGVVGVGALRNALRVKSTWNSPDPAARTEAGKSATMAIFGLGIAGMLGYQAYMRRES